MNNEYRNKAEEIVDSILDKEGIVALDRVRDLMIKAYMMGNVDGQMEQHRLIRQMYAAKRAEPEIQVVYPLRRKFGMERNEG